MKVDYTNKIMTFLSSPQMMILTGELPLQFEQLDI